MFKSIFSALQKKSILLLIIVAVTFISFYPCLRNDFTNWDDNFYVTGNKNIRELTLANIKNIFSFSGSDRDDPLVKTLYTPLPVLSFALEYYFFGLNPGGYHATNLIIHLLNCILVFCLIYLMCRNKLISFLVSLLFGIHPLHVESVAWISERKDLLYSFFFLGSLTGYVYYLQKRNKFYYYISVVSFLLSLLGKPMGITLPVILILYDYLYIKRKLDINVLIEKIPYIILSFIFFIITFIIAVTNKLPEPQPSFIHNIFIASYGLICFYPVKLLVPFKLSAIYPHPPGKDLPLIFMISPLILFLFTLVIIPLLKHREKILFALLFYVITILPAIQILPVPPGIAADRYSYIPSLGLFYITGVFINWYYHHNNSGRKKTFIIILLMTVAFNLSFLTMERCKIWKDSMTLWNDTIEKYPVAEAYYNRGMIYDQNEDYLKALDDFTQAIKIHTLYDEAYNNRGNIYYRLGQYDRAIEDYNRALEINRASKIYKNRGLSYSAIGNYNRAIEDYTMAIKLDPDSIEPYRNRGIIYGMMKNYDKAIEDFTKILSIEAYNKEALYNRSLTYFHAGDYDRAWNDINTMMRLNYEINPAFLQDLKAKTGKK
ncbi:MAG: tetratricopeptide repeat protein [Candidatus Eremiobacterota bacterium]